MGRICFIQGEGGKKRLPEFTSELLNTRFSLRIVCSQDIAMEIAVARCLFLNLKVIFLTLKKSLSRKWWEDQQQQGGCGIGATKLVPVPVAETWTGEEEENEI